MKRFILTIVICCLSACGGDTSVQAKEKKKDEWRIVGNSKCTTFSVTHRANTMIGEVTRRCIYCESTKWNNVAPVLQCK